MTRILLLGGTTEASQMARALAAAGRDAIYSYAGRTGAPVTQPLPLRVGGFGGAEGLRNYLKAERISHVIDATHPFAGQISRNAQLACDDAAVPLITLKRPPWVPQPGDHWLFVPDIAAAVRALPQSPAQVFLAIGKQNLEPFAALPQHHYLLRLVDPPEGPLSFPHVSVCLARGPFDVAGDRALLEQHRITHIVAKNAGGDGASAKLVAARELGLPVIMVDRPESTDRHVVGSVAEVMGWLDHAGTERGV